MGKKAARGIPPVSAAMAGACGTLADELTALLDSVLAATDRFRKAAGAVPDEESAGAGELLRGCRQGWDLLSFFRDEAVRISRVGQPEEASAAS